MVGIPADHVVGIRSKTDASGKLTYKFEGAARLVINRGKREIMCHAYYNSFDRWRVNPMFIQPRSAGSAYACSTTACKNEAGVSGPCRDDAGNVIPDQPDTVHP
jgi:hypothetical protein